MSRADNLLNDISSELNIKRGRTESESMWYCRVVYSAIGIMALASLWDITEESNDDDCNAHSVSITHFKRRIEKLYYGYKQAFPDELNQFNNTPEELSKEIYEMYRNSGFIYHANNYVSASKESKISGIDPCVLIRGANLKRNVYMSGLGTYIVESDSKDCISLGEAFRFFNKTLDEYYSYIVENAVSWSNFEVNKDMEFLRTEPPFTKGYWTDVPGKNNMPSVMKMGEEYKKDYFLYRYNDGEYQKCNIRSYLTENHEHRRIANSLLFVKGNLPPIVYYINGDIVNLKLNYLLPPAELNFLKAYSWPSYFYNRMSNFNRIMQKDIFLAFKEEIEKQGYCFKEESRIV